MPRLTIKHALTQELSLSRRRKVPLLPELQNPVRAQTFLRTLGIEIAFSREGRLGTRMIRVCTSTENTVGTVSIAGAARSNSSHRDETALARIQNE